MATYSASSAKTVTCVASQVDTITLTGTGTELHVWQNSTTPIYYSLAGTGQTPITPTVAGDNLYASMNSYPDVYQWNGNGVVIAFAHLGAV